MSFLTLGWEVTPTQDPRYWLGNAPVPGGQSEADLVRLPAQLIASHTAIIAQSGAGKSFFLGRLIEEILLNTTARCVVLDPNADFRKVNEVESNDLWEKATYDSVKRKGKLLHEKSRDEFMKYWSNIPITIRTGERLPPLSIRKDFERSKEQLKISWTALDIDFFADDVGTLLRSDLFHCHECVRALERLLELSVAINTEDKTDLISEAEYVIPLSRSLHKKEFREAIEARFKIKELLSSKLGKKTIANLPWPHLSLKANEFLLRFRVRALVGQLISVSGYISDVGERFYLAKAREFQGAGILETTVKTPIRVKNKPARLEVIDLPSLRDKNTRLLVTSAILSTKWNNARQAWARAINKPAEDDKRVPTFIVLDEAHNLIPAEPTGKAEIALREQFRTIVAEGRKYGLFLILVSQRPDKLDPMVLSECANTALMRVNSESVLELTKRALSLEDMPPKLLQKCMEFEIGRVLLAGQWVPDGPKIMYCAARRTCEGGRNLRPEFWAVPPAIGANLEDFQKTEAPAKAEIVKTKVKRINKSLSSETPGTKP